MRKIKTYNSYKTSDVDITKDIETPVDTVIERDRSKTKTKIKKRNKETVDLNDHVECSCDKCKEKDNILTVESVFNICRSYVEENKLFELLQLHNWKVKLDVDDTIDEEGIYLGLCEYDTAYSLATVRIAVQGHDTIDDVKDTLMHELCHIVLAEIDSSARALLSTVPEGMQEYVGHQLHNAREHSVINLANIFRAIIV